MQTVDYSTSPTAPHPAAPTEPAHQVRHRVTQRVTVTPVIPRGRTLPTRESLQAAEDGGEVEAHPS